MQFAGRDFNNSTNTSILVFLRQFHGIVSFIHGSLLPSNQIYCRGEFAPQHVNQCDMIFIADF